MIRAAIVTAAMLSLATALGGCGTIPKEHFYTLSAGAPPERTATTDATPELSVAIGAAALLDIVDRPQLVLRMGPNQVTILEQQRWAAPLKTEIPRVVAMNLAQALGTSKVSAYPETAGTDAEYRVALDVRRFESTLGEAVTIEVLWRVRRVAGGEPKNGRSMVHEPTGSQGYDALIAAHSRALVAVSRDIAEAILATGKSTLNLPEITQHRSREEHEETARPE